MTRDRRFRNVLPKNWEVGSVDITDPGNQSPLPRSVGVSRLLPPGHLVGDPVPRMNLSLMCSACHPVGKNGNDSSRVRHWSIVWVSLPHEKHPLTESDDGSGEATSSSVTVPTRSQFSNNVSKSVTAITPVPPALVGIFFHQFLDEEVPVQTYRDRLQRRWCRRWQQLLNDVFDGLRLQRYNYRCRFNFCYLANHTHREPVRARPWLNFHFTVSFPNPTTVNYVCHGSIRSQTVQMYAECRLRLSIDETVSHHLQLNFKVNIYKRPPSWRFQFRSEN